MDARRRRQSAYPQLQVRGFQRGLRLPDPRGAARRESRPPPRIHQRVEPGRLPPDQPRCGESHRSRHPAGGGDQPPRRLTISRKEIAARAEEDRLPSAPLTCPIVNREGQMKQLTKLLRCEHGANAIEYALIASLISIAAI